MIYCLLIISRFKKDGLELRYLIMNLWVEPLDPLKEQLILFTKLFQLQNFLSFVVSRMIF
jgi:hypothetical protein